MNGMYQRMAYALVVCGTVVAVVGGVVNADARAAVAPDTRPDVAAAAVQECDKVAADAVAVHIEVVEWRLSPEAFEQVSAGGGTDLAALARQEPAHTRVMYVFDSVLRTGQNARIQSSAQTPYVRSRKSKDGDVVTAVNYEDVGCRVDLQCDWADAADRARIRSSLSIEISDLVTDTPVALQEEVCAPTMVKSQYRCETVADLGEQRSFVSLTARRQGDADGIAARAYLFHVRYDAVASTSTGGSSR